MPHRWLGLSVMLTGTFMAVMDVFIVNVAIPSIRAGLGASLAEIELVVAGYGLTYAVALITGGRLGDLYGRRRMFIIGVACFTAASVLCGVAPNATALVVARLLQGVAAAILFPQVFSLINVSFPDKRGRSTAFSILGAVLGLSSVAGQLLGGLIVDADLWGLSWRPVFLVNLPLGLTTMLAAPLFIVESRSASARKLDVWGVVVCGLGLSLLLYPLIEGRELRWPGWSIAMLVAAIPTLALFVWQQHSKSRRGASPLLETGLFRHKTFAVGVILVLVFYSTLNSFFFVLAFLLQLGLGQDPLAAGLTYTPLAVAFLVASIAAGRLAPRFGRGVLVVGGAIAALGSAMAGVLAWCAPKLEAHDLIPAFIVLGIGQGLFMTPLLNIVLGDVPESDAGSASGVVSTMQQVGGALGIAVVGVLFFGVLQSTHATGMLLSAAYSQAFAVSAGYSVAATLITLALVFRLSSSPTPVRNDHP